MFLERNRWRHREDDLSLPCAPLYHSAPQAAVNLTIRKGGTVVIMERFDPERYLEFVETYKITHSQLVPSMFSRMLKLPQAVRQRHDLASLEIAIHAAAPCPIQVKEQMISRGGGRSSKSTTAPRKDWGSPRATAPNGWRTKERSARCCSANCTSSTMR